MAQASLSARLSASPAHPWNAQRTGRIGSLKSADDDRMVGEGQDGTSARFREDLLLARGIARTLSPRLMPTVALDISPSFSVMSSPARSRSLSTSPPPRALLDAYGAPQRMPADEAAVLNSPPQATILVE